MVTVAQARKLALSLPESEESSHFQQPDFRVRGKIFATLSVDGTLGTLKLRSELQAMVLDARPDAFHPAAGYWGRQGWTNYHIAKVELGELQGLMEEAWLVVAPKRLAADRAAQPALSAAKPASANLPAETRVIKRRGAKRRR